MKLYTAFDQNSMEWLSARSGVVTASEFDQIVTAKFEQRDGQMPKTYLATKVAEKWTGGALPGAMTLDMEFGKIREEEAIPAYEFEFSEKITRVALITSDDGRIGCSPDGLIGDEGGIEIKCPEAKTHVKYLLAGEVPPDYLPQIHGAMLVTGRKWWKFMSYRRHFPMMVKTVHRDEEIMEALQEALQPFLERMDRAYKSLVTMNGGVEPKPNPFREAVIKQTSPVEERIDLVP
jgi:YqaJ-like viral recombinase domain